MQHGRLLFTLVSLWIFFIATAAYAVCSAPKGFYAEGNYGTSKLLNQNYPGSWNSSGTGASLNVGYKIMPYLAAEVGYTRYGNTDIKTSGTTQAVVRHYSYYAVGKGILPLANSGFEFFGKAGVARVSSQMIFMDDAVATSLGLQSGTHRNNGLYIAAGGQFYVTPELAGNVQWARAYGTTGVTGHNDLYSVGLSFILA